MRPITVVAGPLASADPSNIANGSTPLAGYVLFDGTLATNTSAISVAASQAPAGAGNLTLTSTVVPVPIGYLITVTSDADDTPNTFTVTGTNIYGGAVVETVTGPNTATSVLSKEFATIKTVAISGAAVGNVSVGWAQSPVTLDAPRRVLITAGADESGNTFVITGTNWAGDVISETLAGTNASTSQSVYDYKTVTSVAITSNAAGSIDVGTSGVGGSPWVRFDDWAPSFISIQCSVTGTVNYTLQTSIDEASETMQWVNSSDTNVVAATATKQSNLMFAPKWARVVMNSGDGSVSTTFIQSSNGPA